MNIYLGVILSKNILFLSGTRADFGKLKSLIQSVDKHEDFDYKIFVTGMHLLSKYGSTYKEIEKSGFHNTHEFINQYLGESMDMILSNTIQGLSRYISEEKPDMIVVHGDRVEALAGAIVGSLNNILVAHIEGGERSGTIDELIRHSVSKLSHIHFVANEEAKKRLLQLGESNESIVVFGSPDIDVMKSDTLPSLQSVKEYYNIPFSDYHIVMFHPVTTEVDKVEVYANNLVDALLSFKKENFIVIYPNNDDGTNEILRVYQRLENQKNIKLFPSIRFESFLVLIEEARSIIGNSSAGIREAPIYGVPTLNIGTRQNLRYLSPSIFNSTHETKDIVLNIEQILMLEERYEPSEYFGKGNSAELFIEMLSSDALWSISSQKIFHDRL